MIKRVKNQKGFTLIELIAVIAILGILALLIVPRVGSYTDKAKISKATADMNILKNAIERYKVENASDPAAGLTALTTSTGSGSTQKGPYIDKVPNFVKTTTTASQIMSYTGPITAVSDPDASGIVTLTPALP